MKSAEFNRALTALMKCNKVIRENHDELSLLNDLCRVIVQDVGYRLAWVGYKEYDEERHVSPVSSCGLNAGYVEKANIVWSEEVRGLGPTGTSIRSEKPVVCQNMTTDEKLKPWREDAIMRGYASSIALPLIIDDFVIGALTIYAIEPNAFNTDEVELLQELAASLSFGISHIRQNKTNEEITHSLGESEQRYKTIYNEMAMPILIINPDTLEMKDVNEKACLFYGYSRDEFLKKRLTDIQTLPKEKLLSIASEIIGKKREFLATSHRTSSGELRDIEVYTGVVTIQGKDYVCSTIHDITQRKIIEEQREQFRKFFNSSEDLMVMADPNGAFKSTNPACTKVLGYSESELLSKPFIDFVHPDDRQSTLDEMARQIQRGYSLNFENRYVCKDGSFRYLSWHANFIAEEGITYATARDITDRKMLEISLIKASEVRIRLEERYKRILSASIEGFWMLDMEGNILQANEAYCKMSGYTQEELTHMNVRDIDAIETPEETKRRLMTIEEIGCVRFESKHRCKGGRIMDVDVSVNFIKQDNIMFSFIRDITSRKQMEEAIRQQNLNLQKKVEEEVAKNRERDQLVYEQSRHLSMGELLVNISHHWRQPLCGVSLSVQDIKDAYLHNELDGQYLNKNIEIAMSELKSLSDTIDNFRNFYIHDKEQKEFNISDEINKADALIEGYVKERDIVINKDLDTTLTTRGYPNEFAQVILNILTNAKDSFERMDLPDGIIKIKLYKDGGTGRKIITIMNNGGEVAEDIISKVFDPYFTTKDKTRGTGMGLYMAKVIIEKNMNGTIAMRNSDGWCELRIEL
ncbi:PAS domain S-box protein [Candidatus Magnetominusculus dajiuhuensis]|uniref:PAS domain S-box protein n=1 Tax=Candidatus Magnetominusculus dajiuhuensis TaxID=3137712 RepID=UPI003B427D43